MTDLSLPHTLCVENARNEVHSRNEFRYQPLRLYRNWQVRRLVRSMIDMEDNMLDDIGIERAELQWAARLPLTVNASIAVHERARKRRERVR